MYLTRAGLDPERAKEFLCGRCEHRWTDRVRYQNKTLSRCPSCGARNLVDSSNVRVYDRPDGPR